MEFIRNEKENNPPLKEYPKNRAVPPDVLKDVKLSPEPVDKEEVKR